MVSYDLTPEAEEDLKGIIRFLSVAFFSSFDYRYFA
jgi:plasmid stabilization system protein ParE